MTNVNGNYKKNLPAKYSRVTAAKGKIRQSVSSTKKWAVGMGKKASGEQRFLGKTLPKALWGTAKWAFRHPITATALAFTPKLIKKMAHSPKFSYPKYRQFDKRGRKII